VWVQAVLYPARRERYRAAIVRDGRGEYSVPADSVAEAIR
jgi:hypothetical protein